jgi:hypothetical protein
MNSLCITCAHHPAFGYVDHPPFAPCVLTLFQFLLGSSLYAIRVFPALAQAVSVFLTGVMTKEIGGFSSVNAFEPLLALTLLYYAIRMINGKKDTIPSVACGHNTYYLWSKERIRGSILLQLNEKRNLNGMKEMFESVELAECEYSSPYVSSHENILKVFICRKPKIHFRDMQERGKSFY